MTQEQENFYRHNTVIFDESRDAFLHLLDFYLTNQGITLQRFITINGHFIYHLCFNRYPCCQCPRDTRAETRGSRVLHPPQMDIFFDKTGSKLPGHNHRSKSAPNCCCPVNPNLQLQDLDFILARLLLVNFTTLVPQGSPERIALESLVNIRNQSFAHAKEGKISNSEYQKSMCEIEKCLLVLAKVYGKEMETKQRLRDVAERPLNATIIAPQTTLIQQCQLADTIRRLMAEKTLPDAANSKNSNDMSRRLKDKYKAYQHEHRKRKSTLSIDGTETKRKRNFSPSEKSSDKLIDNSNFQDEHIIPDEIKKMGPEPIQLYLKILKTGTERKRDIRVIIVGKKGSGKTSLTRRLLKDELENIESTNGIEIHIKNSSIKLADGEWITQQDVQDTMNSRLFKEVIVQSQKTAASSKEAEQTDKDNDRSSETNLDPNEKDKISDDTGLVEDEMKSLDSKAKNHFLNICKSEIPKEECANLFLWDFAGDEEFYNTHQIFLAKDVIYLILTKLDDFDDKQGAFKFWFDSVHCFCHPSVEDDVDCLDPPVLVVGTHADMLNGETDCKSHMQMQIDKVAPRIKGHIRGKLVLSNTQDPDDKVNKLRRKILKIAKAGKNWNIELPLKFILLEQEFQNRETTTPILSFDGIRRIASDMFIPITEQDEIELFLRYQHEIGNLIYFMDIPEYVVLNTQWLADAFRCIVTAEKYQYDLHIFEWKEVCSTGRLNGKLLDAIFAKQSRAVRDHKDYLVKLMEKFYILVRPRTLSETGVIEQNSEYYVPCLVKTMALKDLDQRFSVTAINSKSICFCLLFNFLPPMLFNHLLIAFCHKSDFRSATIKKDNNRCPAFFKDIAVFDISSNGCEKLLLAKYENAIQLQVWRYGSVQRRSYEDIRLYAIAEINKLTSERFRLTNVRYEEKMKCARTQYDSLEGIRACIKDTSVTEYYCEEHDEVESFTNDWFGKNNNEVLSAEQLNFTRIGIITLNILCDALYDRLKLDNANVPQRDRCDITFLYDFNRNKSQNKHISNKPVKKLEKVEDIQTNHTNIGDDFERIRLIRNEMQHSKFFSLPDTRCEELFKVAKEILHRFDNVNNPGKSSYCDKADEIKRMTYTTNDHEYVTKRIQDQHHQHYTGDNMVVNNIFNCCGHTYTK